MTDRSYAVWVYGAGVTGTSSSQVEFTLDLADLHRVPVVTGPQARVSEGRVESRPWTIDVVDRSGTMTSRLADSTGRLVLLNRIVKCRRQGGGTWATIGGGRLTDIGMTDQVATYQLTVQDEGFVARANECFTTNTTRLYPPGLHTAYGPFQPAPKARGKVQFYSAAAGIKFYHLVFHQDFYWPTDLGVEAIENDLVTYPSVYSTAGNFRFTRCRIGSRDYPIISIGGVFPIARTPDPTSGWTPDLRAPKNQGEIRVNIAVGSSTGLSAGDFSSAFLHMFGAPPSEATPLHIGTSAGLHPMQLVKNLFDGSYQSTAQPRVRYSTAAFNDGSTGLLVRQMEPVRFRVTSPAILGPWIEDHLFAPFQVVPFVDTEGRINPRSVALPGSTSVSVHEFTGANLRPPHPDWLHPQREQVTLLRIKYTQEGPIIGTNLADEEGPGFRSYPSRSGSDLITAVERESSYAHDRVSQFGRIPRTVEALGTHSLIPGGLVGQPLGNWWGTVDPTQVGTLATNLQREFFDRYGDGPVTGKLYGMSNSEHVKPGDWVTLSLETMPNPGIQARGGSRLVQIVGRDDYPEGPVFDYLDGGPAIVGVGAPSLALALSTVDKKHTVKATVSGLASGAKVELQTAESNTTAAPSATSSLWRSVASTGGNGVYSITARPAGTKHWARARGTAQGRIRSGWTYSAGVNTSALTAPSGLAASNVKAGTATVSWTNGEAAYPIQLFVDLSTAASLDASNLYQSLPAGTKSHNLWALDANQKHLAAVRHFDPYGGASNPVKTSFTTLSNTSTNFRAAAAPLGFWVESGKV